MQVNQNVNAANFMQVGSQTNAAGQTTKLDTAKEGQDFASFLKPAAEKKEQGLTGVEPAPGTKTQGKADGVKKENGKTDNSPATNAKASSQPEKNKVETAATVSKSQDTDLSDTSVEETVVVDDGVAMTEEETEVLLETIGQLLQNVMNQFDLTPEELTGKLKDFGMEEPELMTLEGVKTFFLNMENAEPADLLVNEELNTALNDFVGEFEQLVETLDVPLETITDFLEDNNLEEVFVQLEEHPIVNAGKEQLISDGSEDSDDSESVTEIPQEIAEPEVIVTDNRQQIDEGYNNNKQDTSNNQQTTGDDTQKTELSAPQKTVREEHHKDAKASFENPILQAINESIDNIAEPIAVDETQVSNRQIIEQIVEQVRVEMNQSSTSLEMQLYPEHLGKIQIQVVSKDGAMTARIAAETEAAKQAIESGLTNLKDAMEQQNIKVEAIEVMVSTTGFGQNMEEQNTEQQQGSTKSGRHGNLSGIEDEEADEEAAEAEKMRAAGSSVSYTA